ncbi:MAG: hypothetical protein Q8S73_33025 [Deltaproteobacteria bacterium]|nr:hypothetical protein [Myxococcales bacterium]MDP3218969.1 hypothetical protein [Deltaproteobacteria bacterium]
MTDEPRLWVLNFDAEDELAHPGAMTPSAGLRARFEALARRTTLLAPGDSRLDEFVPPDPAWRGMPGAAWCPTPRALRALARAGARLPDAPSAEVLRAANHRRLMDGRLEALPGARYVHTRREYEETVARGSVTGSWLLKRAYSYNGRGRCRWREGADDPHVARWVDAALATGEGLQVEPEVPRSLDLGLHGELGRDGELRWGALTVQRGDAFGAWEATEVAPPGTLTEDESRELDAARRAVVTALRSVGYFGPFGVDAYRWSGGFVPCCDVNARYTMGWAVGMSGR